VNLKGNLIIRFLIGLCIFQLNACVNPFAPKLDFSSETSGNLSDLTSVDGVLQNLQYSYSFKDSTIYGKLLAEDFLFTYRNYDAGFDVSWGRDEEMKATYGLFQNAERLDLIWNNVVASSQDSLEANLIRGFNLTITFNPTDVIRIDGRVNLLLKKNSQTNNWAIHRWVDESNF
jgi:hypothetical protein